MALRTQKLNRRSVVMQVRDDLRRQVATGELVSGDQLPPEIECAAAYGVSRTTVREAYGLLEQEGLVVLRRGQGRFVLPTARQQMPGSITMFSSMTEFLRSKGYSVSSRVLSVGTRLPTQAEADALRLPPGRTVVHLERLRLGDGVPLVYSHNVFDAELLAGGVDQVDWSGSVIALFETLGQEVLTSVVEVQAVNLPAELAREHGLDTGTAWLYLDGTTFDEKGNPNLLSRDWVRGDIRTLHVVLRYEG
jgi:GntR family transcriptional regulator